MATLREVLAPFGLDRIKMDPWIREHALDVELKGFEFAASRPKDGQEPHGMLQTFCGGIVVASFYPVRDRWPLVLRVVLEGENMYGHNVLELVQTA